MAKPGPKERKFEGKDIEQLKVLARCHCPDSEICAWFGISERTLQRRFGALLKDSREQGKANIRAKQFQMAMQGDKTMLIWVGKQILGQRERAELDIHKVPDEQLVQIVQERLGSGE